MNHTEAIKLIMKKSRLTQTDVADRAGLSSKQIVSKLLNQKTTMFYKIVALLDAMGYEMVAMPKNCPPLLEDAYALRREDYQ